MKLGPRAKALMHWAEGCRLTAYLCPADVPTIGYGATYYLDGERVKLGDRITQEQAEELFDRLVARDFAPVVAAALGDHPTTPAQFGAMVSLAYNVGTAAFRRSSVLRRHNAGDFDGAADAFLMWDKAGGKRVAGLAKRRLAERALYRSDWPALARLTDGRVA